MDQSRSAGGGRKPVVGGPKVCWGTDRDQAVKTVHRLWPKVYLPGELGQILPSPKHFEQACELVTQVMVRDNAICGDDSDERAYAEADFDEVYVNQIRPDHQGFFDFYRTSVPPRLRDG